MMNELIERQYRYVLSSVMKDGRIVDKKLKSPLNFQYHYTSFIFASLLKKNFPYVRRVFRYFSSIPPDVRIHSSEFNNFFLLLSLIYDKDKSLDRKDVLNLIYHRTDEELYKLNNNFRALRLVNIILHSKIEDNREFDEKIQQEVRWIADLQFDDGFFPDSNMEYQVIKNSGVPHLTYHTKITMCCGLSYLFGGRQELIDVFFRGLQRIIEISDDNYFFFYGRSTNSLFGYGSLFVSFILAYIFSSDGDYLRRAFSVLDFLRKYQHVDGHISLNLNKDDRKRPAFDGYMYDIVYNAYSNALFIFGHKLLEEYDRGKENRVKNLSRRKEVGKPVYESSIYSHKWKKDGAENELYIYRNSGFVVYKSGDSHHGRGRKLKLCLNFKGHQNSLKHRFDSRVSPFSLLYYFIDDENLIPACGFPPQPLSNYVERKNLSIKLRSILFSLIHFDWLPLLGGNSFFYKKKGKKFFPYECSEVKIYRNKIELSFTSVERGFSSRLKSILISRVPFLYIFRTFLNSYNQEISAEKFYAELHFENGVLTYTFYFPEKVDELFYTFREFRNSNLLKYEFDKKYRVVKKIDLETSFGYADLYILKFSEINHLKIRVSSEISYV